MAKPSETTSATSSSTTAENMSTKTLSASSSATSSTAGAARSTTGVSGESATTSRATSRGNITERKGQFLITARRPGGMQPMGLAPLNFGFIEQTLRASPDIDVVDTVGPKNIIGALADGMSDVASVLVAQMSEVKAQALYQQAQGRLIVERDHHLSLMDPAFKPPTMVAGTIPPSSGTSLKLNLSILGQDNAPVKDAEVYIFGSFLPSSSATDAQGKVSMSIFGETVQSIRSIYVKPRSDYWSFYQLHPALSEAEENTVILQPLADWPSLPNFPQQQSLGWGQRAMRLDQVPDNFRGQGVKIAIIDSGAATTHEDLSGIRFGFDIINKKTNPATWNEDSISHGSHCAGVIVGSDNRVGIRGFAPDAEVHICKIFPGGQISHLIDALEYCIEQQIDVANLSLGGIEPSEALEQQILRAKRAGVACIVAAGNSGGAVQYPASSPNVMAVAAIGRLNEFPPDSYHTQTVTSQIDANGFFSAKFSCSGPEIAVCAPGVAITSSVGPNNFAAWDGTSMAAPHITGLAALVLAHHSDFQALFKMRGPERVERLFQIIKMSARGINLGDPKLTGYGLPDALIALGRQPKFGFANARRASDIPAMAAAETINLAPQWAMNPGLGATMGGYVPGNIGQAGINPVLAAYVNQPQLLQQAWYANPWR